MLNPPQPHTPFFFSEDILPDQTVNISFMTFSDYSIGLHAHSFVELNVVRGGSGRHFVGEEWRPVQQGDVFVIPPNFPHAYENGEQLSVYHVLIQKRLLAERVLELLTIPGYLSLFAVEPYFATQNAFTHSLRLEPDGFEEVNRLIDLIRTEASLEPFPNKIGSEALTLYLISVLCRLYNQQHDASRPQPPILMQAVQSALEFINKEYESKLTLDDLAAVAGMGRDKFGRLFRNVIGLTPIEYLNHTRVGAAREMLLTSERKITEIALDTGFYDSAHFTRSFSKIMGLTPTRFRQRSKE